jgi:hypothetical protein
MPALLVAYFRIKLVKGKRFDILKGLRSNVMDAEELLRRYAGGERDFAGVDLRLASLRVAHLSVAA